MKMKPGDWIDAREIDSLETLEAVREAVREMGWDAEFGFWDGAARERAAVLVLDDDGDLLWEEVLDDDGRQIHVSDLIGTQPKDHPAAAILREIAEVAEWHPRPWEAFECQPSTGPWEVPGSPHGFFCMALIYPERVRRKPSTKRIGNYDVPLPERKAPEVGTQYWVADPTAKRYRSRLHRCTTWVGDEHEYRLLHRGLIYLDPKSAEIHGRALASLMQEDEE